MNRHDLLLSIDEYDVERQRCIRHPKGEGGLPVEYEQHAAVFWQIADIHQAHISCFVVVDHGHSNFGYDGTFFVQESDITRVVESPAGWCCGSGWCFRAGAAPTGTRNGADEGQCQQ